MISSESKHIQRFTDLKNVIGPYLFFIVRLTIATAAIYTYNGLRSFNDNKARIVLDNYISAVVLSFITFLMIIQSILSGNIFKYNGSLFLVFQNAMLLLIATIFSSDKSQTTQVILRYSTPFIYVLEGISMFYFKYKFREEINNDILKNTGLSPEIFAAYNIRKRLSSFSLVCLQWTVVLFFKICLPPKTYFEYIYSTLSIVLFGILAHFSIELRIFRESKKSRILSCVFHVIKICFIADILCKILVNVIENPDEHSRNINAIVMWDIFILTIFTIYNLYLDYKMIGSGLENYKARELKIAIE
jgi:hypothetical protein